MKYFVVPLWQVWCEICIGALSTDDFKVEVGASTNTSGCLVILFDTFIHYYYVMLARQLHRWSSICRSDCGRDQRDCPTNWSSKKNH